MIKWKMLSPGSEAVGKKIPRFALLITKGFNNCDFIVQGRLGFKASGENCVYATW